VSRTADAIDELLAADPRLEPVPEPAAIVILGATGDLTRRKLLPALHHLTVTQRLPPETAIVGVGRRAWTDDEFRAAMRASVEAHGHPGPIDEGLWRDFAGRLSYVRAPFDDPGGYHHLAAHLAAVDDRVGTAGNRLFYLATAPEHFQAVAEGLAGAGQAPREGSPTFSRLIVEKPFGHDLRSARELNERLWAIFPEDSIYRIDHYLGKETVQNLFVLRFANAIFEPIWNSRYVDHVQITVAESIGVEGRGDYYERSGALRDVLQNHMLQVLALIAMEPAARFASRELRDEKAKVLRAIPELEGERLRAAVRAQYTAGWIDGEPVPGYREEEGVPAESTTETYAALRLEVQNWRWGRTPFYLRTGKRLPRRTTEVAVQFRTPPHLALPAEMRGSLEANLLVVRIQPDEGATLRLLNKVPGTGLEVRPVGMDFAYGTAFTREIPEAYERLLLDCLLGDATLFTRWDEVERAWEIVDPLLAAWGRGAAPMAEYPAGTWGPPEAEALIAADGRAWRTP
jgi:glucose-6-phosphate 1-dehydrogenase